MNKLSRIIRYLIILSAFITFATLLFVVGYILVRGIPYIKPSLFALEYTTENVSLLPTIVGTIIMIVLALLISAPLGIFTGFYLVEYARRDNKLVEIIRITAETLSGIPSIVYGLFGLLFFVTALSWGFSLIAGAFTLAIMILPLIMRSTEEALLAVPDMLREASLDLAQANLGLFSELFCLQQCPEFLRGLYFP